MPFPLPAPDERASAGSGPEGMQQLTSFPAVSRPGVWDGPQQRWADPSLECSPCGELAWPAGPPTVLHPWDSWEIRSQEGETNRSHYGGEGLSD